MMNGSNMEAAYFYRQVQQQQERERLANRPSRTNGQGRRLY